LQQDGVDDRDERGTRSHAEGDRDDAHRDEARPLPQEAERVAEVLHRLVQPVAGAALAELLARLLGIAELEARFTPGRRRLGTVPDLPRRRLLEVWAQPPAGFAVQPLPVHQLVPTASQPLQHRSLPFRWLSVSASSPRRRAPTPSPPRRAGAVPRA